MLAFVSCHWQPLQTKRQENTSHQLQLQGFYYEWQHDTQTSSYEVFCLYQNGVLHHRDVFVSDISKVGPIIQHIDSPNWPDSWGVYTLKANDIFIDRWYLGEGSPSGITKGKIINDSTFMLIDYRKKIDTFHFKAFLPKPDSTNQFIK